MAPATEDEGEAVTADKAKEEMESARLEVMECEKDIQNIKVALRQVAGSTGISQTSAEAQTNSLGIAALKVLGLPDAAKPCFNLQLSSPVEERKLSKLYDPLDENAEGSFVKFSDVETDVATLTVTAWDSDVPLGSSAAHDVTPLCEFDPMSPKKKVTQLDVAIVPDGKVGPLSEVPSDVELGTKENVTENESNEDGKDESFEDAVEEVKSGNDGDDKKQMAAVADGTAQVKHISVPVSNAAAGVTDIEDAKSDDDILVSKEEESEKSTQLQEAPVEETSRPQGETSTEEEGDDKQKKVEHGTEPETSMGEEIMDTKGAPKLDGLASAAAPVAEGGTDNKSAMIETAVCTVTLRVEYSPSANDQREELYDLLNKASKKKAAAIDKLRRSAAAVSRVATKSGGQSQQITASTGPTPKRAVKAGFLNKKAKKKEPGFLTRLYERSIGPSSLFRKVFPIAKNYCIFFGVVALFHFRGQDLALPPPV